MHPAIAAALVTAVGSLVLSIGSAVASSRARKRTLEFEAHLKERATERERSSQAKVQLNRYSDPLLDAVWHLGHRIDSIRNWNFLSSDLHSGDFVTNDVLMTTLYRIGQYFAWREIVRSKLSLLRFESSNDTKRTADLLENVTRSFAKETVSEGRMLIGRDQQRAIGELMTVDAKSESPGCMNYALFCQSYDATLARWFGGFPKDLLACDATKDERLSILQTGLATLVNQLDEDGRYLDEQTHEPRGWCLRSPHLDPPPPR